MRCCREKEICFIFKLSLFTFDQVSVMNNIKVSLVGELKPYAKCIPEMNKPVLRAILKGSF
jgi:hypothetical protein